MGTLGVEITSLRKTTGQGTHTVKLNIMIAKKIGLNAGSLISIAIGSGVGIFYLIKDVIL